MKLTAFLVLSVMMQLNARTLTHAQDITLKISDRPEKVFEEITRQTGYTFGYKDSFLEEVKVLSVDVKGASITKTLDACFKGLRFGYKVMGKVVVVSGVESYKSGSALLYQNADSDTSVIDISGTVLDENGNPMAGVTVTVKNSSKATATNSQGKFIQNRADRNSVLVFSGTNVERLEISVFGKSQLVVTLKSKIVKLDEVQIIAYGTTTRRLSTGNVSTVKATEIEKQPVNNPLLSLQGRVPGMQITQTTGFAGAGVQVNIRGINNLTGSNIPLYIIDGVPYPGQNLFALNNSGFLGYSNGTTGNPLSYLNPADIESIDVLKDGDATAIYGSRGANGVVLITTKKGKAGRTRTDFNIQSGWGKVARKMNLLNTRQYLDMRNEAFRNDAAVPDKNADYDLTFWDTTRNTDWQKELIGGTSHYNDFQASISGGSANTQFLIGSGYHKETTVFPGSFNDQKGSVHFNISNVSPNGKFKLSASGMYVVDRNYLPSLDLTQHAMQLPPNSPAMYNEDGTLNWATSSSGTSTWLYSNPAALLLSKYNIRTNNLVSTGLLSYEIVPDLNIKSSFGYTNTQTNNIQTLPFAAIDPYKWATSQRSSVFNDNNIQALIIEPQVNYNRNISNGILTVLLGTTFQRNTSASQSLEAKGFNSDQVMEDIKSATDITALSSLKALYKYSAFFGRLNYNWQDKYLINITGRRDGSSRFGPANQFHNFWSVAGGWVFSKEKIIENELPLISFGKLRTSYGSTGSDDIGDYTFMDLYEPVSVGVPYQGATGISPTSIFTPDLAWQETKKLEAAIEMGFLRDRIIISASFYRNRSSNQLTGSLLPAITGFTQINRNLNAIVQNRGWEIELKTVNVNNKQLRWSSSFNLTANRNKLASGANGLSAYYQQKIGHALSTSFVYHFLGVDPITGLNQFSDSHGKSTLNPNPSLDMLTPIDISVKFYGGFQNSFTYRGLQLDFLFQFAKQPCTPVYKYNSIPGYLFKFYGSNQPASVLDHWQKPGDVSSNQRFSQNLSSLINSYTYALSSDQAYEDASYIRLSNISLSWQIPTQWKGSLIQSIKMYIQAQNLLTITNYQGLNPETQSSITLPPLRVITMGLQLVI